MTRKPLRLAVLISGGGRTLLNLHDRILDRTLDAVIDVVVCSRADAVGGRRAKQRGLHIAVVEHARIDAQRFHQAVEELVDKVDLVLMAGFAVFWRIPDRIYGRVMNIHPALLPDFGGRGMYGLRVHQAVLAAGRTESGCTVHFCDNEYDHGPVILQRRVPVLPDDTPETLAQRVFEQECIAYPEAVRLFAAGRIRLEGNRVRIVD